METYHLVLLCIGLWALFYANAHFRISAKFDGFRFRLFAQRDQLAIAAMRGEIDPNSKEYLVLCRMINTLVNIAERYDPFSLVRSILAFKNDADVSAEIQKTRDDALSNAYPIQKVVLKEVFCIARDLFEYNTRSLLWFMPFLRLASGFHERLSHWMNNLFSAKEFLREQQDFADCRC